MDINELWSKIELTNGCWNWLGGKQKDGYGTLVVNGVSVQAHRLMYELFKGKIPKGMCVCHHCDNPSCVNPSHLFLGTRADNNRDRANKGRTKANVGQTMKLHPERRARGERQGSAKLTEADVKEIRELYSGGLSQRILATMFGVSKTCIGEIARGENWRHIW